MSIARTAAFALLYSQLFAGESASTQQEWLRRLQFSPDGHYVLAQSESEIAVLSVQPFAIMFRIRTEQADLAHFTPDSTQIVFVGSTTRVDANRIALASAPAHVERWEVASHSRLELAPLPAFVCGTEELSPDGRVFACLDLKSTLRFVEVASRTVIFEKKEFTWLFRQDIDPEPLYFGQLGSATIDFSPDGHFVLVRPGEADGELLAFDLWKRSKIALTGQKRLLKNTGTTAFLTPNRIIAWKGASKDDLHHGVANASIMTFPAGLPLSMAKVPYGRFLVHAADPDFAIVRPFGSYADLFFGRTTRADTVRLRTGLVIISNTLALDVFGSSYIGEPSKADVGLYAIGRGLQARIHLHTALAVNTVTRLRLPHMLSEWRQ